MEDLQDWLNDLLSFIRCDGRWNRLFNSPGIHTWPPDDDPRSIHQGCLELERRGLIRRETDEADHIFWLPVDGKE
jgi:hypothetical protein